MGLLYLYAVAEAKNCEGGETSPWMHNSLAHLGEKKSPINGYFHAFQGGHDECKKNEIEDGRQAGAKITLFVNSEDEKIAECCD